MRNFAAAVLIGVLGLNAGSALANEVNIHKYTADEIKSACSKAGGSFSQDAGGYGCGTDCHGGPGTDCLVSCKNGQACVAQVIGRRKPTNLLSALQAPAGSPR